MSARLFVSAALAVFATIPAQAAEARYALIVGVNEYDKKQFPALHYAENDAKELAAVLRPAGYRVRLLLGSSAGADEATRANITAAIDDVLGRVNKNDVLVIGLAGHGVQVPVTGNREEPFFVPKDGVPDQTNSMVSLDKLLQKLNDESGSQANLVLVDACRDNPDPNRGGISGHKITTTDGTAILFSCSRGQKAYENEALKHGLFFHFVLKGLRGAAVNEYGDVTWSGLATYVQDRVDREFGTLVKADATDKQRPHEVKNLSHNPVLLSAARPARTRPRVADSARALVSRAITAHGGAEALDRYKASRASIRGTLYLDQKYEYTGESVSQEPDFYRVVIRVAGSDGAIIQTLRPSAARVTRNGTELPLSDAVKADLEQYRLNVALRSLTPLLRDKTLKMRLLDERTFNGVALPGIEVTGGGLTDPVRMYFDPDSLLLTRVESRGLDGSGNPVERTEILEDYREQSGIKVAFRTETFQNQKRSETSAIVSLKLLERLDPKEMKD